MICKKLLRFLIVSLLLGFSGSVNACGFYETESDYQAMMFRVRLPEMDFYRPFEYTMRSQWANELNSDPYLTDRMRNCKEWALACRKKVSIDAIYALLYQTDAQVFLTHLQNNEPNESLQKNKFLQFLRLAKNQELLDYLIVARKAEMLQQNNVYRFENWDEFYSAGDYSNSIQQQKQELYNYISNRLKTKLSPFLTQRYAYQLCRLTYELDLKPDANELYNKYFGKVNPNSLMSAWALIYKAHALKGDDRLRALIQVFEGCNEKKFRCVQLISATDKMPLTLKKSEKAIFLQMQALQDPGKSLAKLQQIRQLQPDNKGLYFLISREINKLEDWLFTPSIYEKFAVSNNDPFRDAYFDSWDQFLVENPQYRINQDSINKVEVDNYKADLTYLSGLKSFIEEVRQKSTGHSRDFYSIALSHLALLQENATEAEKYLAEIPESTLPSILVQKKLEELWLAIQTKDIQSSAFEKLFIRNIALLEKIDTEVLDTRQMLYTVTQTLANKYLQNKQLVKGNLMLMRSDFYRNGFIWGSANVRYFSEYEQIQYFDKNAGITDIDELLRLLQKPRKTKFEQFLCADLEQSVNNFRDLKGTIAFRNKDLKTAYEAFSTLPTDFWNRKSGMFENEFNKDPFKPKGIGKNNQQSSNYKFNKATFIKTLLELQKKALTDKKNASTYYSKLGDAWFNTSYWGNAWMMHRYSWSCMDAYYVRTNRLPAWMQNYMLALEARKYYLRAYKTAKNNEQKAYATLMLHYITRLSFQYNSNNRDYQRALYYGNLFRNTKLTHTFAQYDCPGIERFLEK